MLMYKRFLALPLTGESFNQRFLNVKILTARRGQGAFISPPPVADAGDLNVESTGKPPFFSGGFYDILPAAGTIMFMFLRQKEG